jgi:hypothetical protein
LNGAALFSNQTKIEWFHSVCQTQNETFLLSEFRMESFSPNMFYNQRLPYSWALGSEPSSLLFKSITIWLIHRCQRHRWWGYETHMAISSAPHDWAGHLPSMSEHSEVDIWAEHSNVYHQISYSSPTLYAWLSGFFIYRN